MLFIRNARFLGVPPLRLAGDPPFFRYESCAFRLDMVLEV